MKLVTKSRLTGIYGVFFAGLLLGSCLKKSNVEPVAVKTFLSVMNLATAAPAAEVYINNYRETDAIQPGVSFNYYVGTTPGQLDIKFKKAGSDSVIAALPSSFYDSLQFYTLVLYNDPLDAAKVKAVKMRDDFSSIKMEKTLFRFFTMNSDPGAVNLYLGNELVSPERKNADIIGNENLRTFQQFAPGTYNIKVKQSGTDSLIAQSTVAFAPENAYTIFLHGVSNGSGASKALKLVVLRATN